MQPKPSHLGPKYAEQFKDTSIVEVYHQREPYVPETLKHLADLVRDTPRIILDAGCGLGDLARLLVTGREAVERVDAVDFSMPMIEKGKRLPGGDDRRLHWICGAVEEVALQPPYALIVAGDSVHWMEWDVVFPRFQQMLTAQGSLAIVGRGTGENPWDEEVWALCARYSTNQEYAPYNLIEELKQRHLFQLQGTLQTQPVPFVQSGEGYLLSFHSRNGLSYDRMSRANARAFDAAVRSAIAPFLQDGQLSLSVVNLVQWGQPLAGFPNTPAASDNFLG